MAAPTPGHKSRYNIGIPGPPWVGCLAALLVFSVPAGFFIYVLVLWPMKAASASPLHAAAARGDIPEMERLLSLGVSPNEMSAYYDCQPLHSAATSGQSGAVRALIAAHANVNGRDAQSSTPLHRVSLNDASRALPSATEAARNAAAILLLENGADLNARNNHGSTPLHDAVSGLDVALIKILMDHGADASIRDSQGYTPLDLVPMFLSGSDARLATKYLTTPPRE